MATVYSVDVNINLLNAGGAGGGGAAGLRDVNSQLDEVSRKTQGVAGQWSKLFVAHEVERFGAAGVHAFAGIIKSAADLDETMMNVRLGLGLTAEETSNLKTKFMEMDQLHKTSSLDMAKSALIMQESGVRTVTDMMTLMEPGNGREGLATFQDIMMSRANPMSSEASTRLGMQFVDTAGSEGPEAQANMLDLVVRALKSDPQSSPQGLLNAFQNIHRTGNFAGLGLEQQMQIAAMTTMAGQSGRESTQIGGLIAAMDLTGHKGTKAAEKRAAGLRELGVMDAKGDPTGDVLAVLETLSHHDPKAAATKHLLATAFPEKREQQEVMEMTQPGKQHQLQGIITHWKDLASATEQHKLLMTSLNSQLAVFHSNMTDINTGMAPEQMLKGLGGFMEGLNELAGWVKKFEAAHPLASGSVGAGIGVGGAALEIGAKAAQIAIMAKMLGVGGSAGIGGAIATGFAGISTALVAALPVALTAGLGYLLGKGPLAPLEFNQDDLADKPKTAGAATGAGAGGSAADHLRKAANLLDHSDKHHIAKAVGRGASNGFGVFQGTTPDRNSRTR